ncbi:MAG: GNAT family N-acetyltransferase [Nitrospiraceae bacterium]|nr:GNAT family N-acetyltransferase [Nitrospiraceae bacterium]
MYQASNETFLLMQGRFLVKIAETRKELEQALRLRYEVFNVELNAGLSTSHINRLDTDEYDKYCDHLIVVDTAIKRVVGTYRLLLGHVAEFNIGYYSENEFDLGNIRKLEGEKLELGRSCVHRDYRTAQVINLLWAGIARYVDRYDVRYLFGCASLYSSAPEEINRVHSFFNSRHRAAPSEEVFPLRRIAGLQQVVVEDCKAVLKSLPPLIKGYMGLGATVCGEPAYDPIFRTTDFFVLLETNRILSRYRRRFFHEEEVLCPAS